MAENSNIAWTNHTVNFWWGCQKVSPGCTNCYAETLANRFDKGSWGSDPRILRVEKALDECRKLDKAAAKAGRNDLVFTNSMADMFEDHRQLIHARETALAAMPTFPNLTFQVLTKRPENVTRMVPAEWLQSWPSNVWLGTSVENQKYADERIPELLRIPARVRFLSVEPMLGPVDLSKPVLSFTNERQRYPFPSLASEHRTKLVDLIDWVIVGGESGDHFRPVTIPWMQSIADQCRAAGVPCFVKQDSARKPGQQGRIPADLWALKQIPTTDRAKEQTR